MRRRFLTTLRRLAALWLVATPMTLGCAAPPTRVSEDHGFRRGASLASHPVDQKTERASDDDASAYRAGVTTRGCAEPDASAGVAACLESSGTDSSTATACIEQCTHAWEEARQRSATAKASEAIERASQACVRETLAGQKASACARELSGFNQLQCETRCRTAVSDSLRAPAPR
jgi:hypothetical protein